MNLEEHIETSPLESKYDVEVGDLVRFISSPESFTREKEFYPPYGTIGEVTGYYDNEIRVAWLNAENFKPKKENVGNTYLCTRLEKVSIITMDPTPALTAEQKTNWEALLNGSKT